MRAQAVTLGLLLVGAGWAFWKIEQAERESIKRSDELRARQDPKHRAKNLEQAVADRLAAWRKRIERKALLGE